MWASHFFHFTLVCFLSLSFSFSCSICSRLRGNDNFSNKWRSIDPLVPLQWKNGTHTHINNSFHGQKQSWQNIHLNYAFAHQSQNLSPFSSGSSFSLVAHEPKENEWEKSLLWKWARCSISFPGRPLIIRSFIISCIDTDAQRLFFQNVCKLKSIFVGNSPCSSPSKRTCSNQIFNEMRRTIMTVWPRSHETSLSHAHILTRMRVGVVHEMAFS